MKLETCIAMYKRRIYIYRLLVEHFDMSTCCESSKPDILGISHIRLRNLPIPSTKYLKKEDGYVNIVQCLSNDFTPIVSSVFLLLFSGRYFDF